MLFYRGQVPADMAVDATLRALAQSEVQYPLRYGYSCVGRVVEVAAEAHSARLTPIGWIAASLRLRPMPAISGLTQMTCWSSRPTWTR